MSALFTRGEWFVADSGIEVQVEGGSICEVHWLPNAKLIAAAPNLYAACVASREVIDRLARGEQLSAEEAYAIGRLVGGAIHKAETGK